MKKVKLRWLVLLLVFSIGIVSPILSGCSGSGSETVAASGAAATTDTTATTTTTDTTSTNPYSGDGTVSGKIDLSSLSASDSTFLSSSLSAKPSGNSKVSASNGGKRYAVSGTDIADDTTAVVKLYVLDAQGELEDTGITGDMTVNGQGDAEFSFAGVKDDVNYIVRYLKIVPGGSAIEVKANAYIPKGETAPASAITVSPQSTIVVETLVNAILDATNGTGIEQTVVNSIIDSVKTAIETLVVSGAIQIPSMIVEVAAADLDALLTEDVSNANLSNTSGLLLSDEAVVSELGVAKAASQASLFDLSSVSTAAEKRALLKKVFDELLGDGDMPDFMLQFFGDVYIENLEKTVTELMAAISAGLEFSGAAPAGLTKSGGILAFTDELASIYALVDKKEAGTLTADDKAALADVPPVIMGLFPRALATTLDASTSLNIPQGLAFTIYIVDGYIKETLGGTDTITASQGSGGSGVSYEKQDFVDFNPMAPGSLMDVLGFNARAGDYAGLSIEELWIHPGKIWIEGTGNAPGQEVDMLSAGACISDVMSMVDPTNPAVDLSGAVAQLTYPKADGTTAVILLVNESTLLNNGGGGGGMGPGSACFVLDPWRETAPPTQGQSFQPATDRLVTDFASGTYTVEVMVGAETVTKSYSKKVITGMSEVYPTLVSPLAWPNWPGDSASQAERDAFDSAMAAYNLKGATRYSAIIDNDTDPTNDVAKVTVTWTAPEVTLPAGVKMGYSLDVGKGGCDQNGCTWQQVYSTWEQDKILFVTAFTIPVNLVKDDNVPYQLNINAVFIDSQTGEELGQGGHANAEFWVADPVDLTATFDITGNADPAYKVVLFKETYNPDAIGNQHTRTPIVESAVTNGAYTLSPPLGDFFVDGGAWYGIVMYQDTNGSNTFDDADMQVWPDGENMWFDTWGGTLRIGKESCVDGVCNNTDKTIFGGETITGPSWVTITDTDTFTISGTATDGQNVVLLRESWDQSTNTSSRVVVADVVVGAVTAGVYTMTPTIGDFTSSQDAWFSFVTYTNIGQPFDPDVDSYTSPASGMNVYFDAWGGKLKYVVDDCSGGTTANFNCAHSETGIIGGETVTGPAF